MHWNIVPFLSRTATSKSCSWLQGVHKDDCVLSDGFCLSKCSNSEIFPTYNLPSVPWSCVQTYILHTLTFHRPTQPVWYSAGMMWTLRCQMAVMQCNTQPGVRLVSTSWVGFAAYHLTPVTHAPSLSQSTMYVCSCFCLLLDGINKFRRELGYLSQKSLVNPSIAYCILAGLFLLLLFLFFE